MADTNPLTSALLGGLGAAIAFVCKEAYSKRKDRKKELRNYRKLLQTVRDELGFHIPKLTLICEQLATILQWYERLEGGYITPSFTPSATFLERLKSTANDFYEDQEIVKSINHCHFELCHVIERLVQLRATLAKESFGFTRDASGRPPDMILQVVAAKRTNVQGVRELTQTTIQAFRDAISQIEAKLTSLEHVLLYDAF